MQRHKHTTILDNNPLWYKDAIVYAVHVRAFKDNDGDGIGDLPELTENWHRFYSHQPDLNYDNPQVQDAILDSVDFWLEQGVDGLRLDAVPYLYERDSRSRRCYHDALRHCRQ